MFSSQSATRQRPATTTTRETRVAHGQGHLKLPRKPYLGRKDGTVSVASTLRCARFQKVFGTGRLENEMSQGHKSVVDSHFSSRMHVGTLFWTLTKTVARRTWTKSSTGAATKSGRNFDTSRTDRINPNEVFVGQWLFLYVCVCVCA